ncbi:COG2717 Predicted membrane protein [Oxalobacteraceae bacterium]
MRFGPRQLLWAKWMVFGLSLLPLLRLIVLGLQDRLTANPIEFITRATGDWTLYFLCLTLAVTPLRRLTGLNALIRFRRMLGLFTFFYASLHFLTFIWFDHFFDLAEMMRDVLKRPFIAMGFSAFVLLVPLALTSNDLMLRKLGRRWSVLHRLIYLIAILALLHFWWMRAGKHNFAEPLVMGAVVAVLLALRLIWLRRDTLRRG